MTTVVEVADLGVAAFCDELFSSMTRSDQRRWAEVYVRGLVSVPGRKSIRRICDDVVGWRADQCLQQFLNQSPWRWEPVRRALAQHAVVALRPEAWIVEDVVFPKNGGSSVGVARQYASSERRMLNCQLGIALFMANEHASCAVNWRLRLPESWDNDHVRRSRARLPEDERSRPRWQHILDVIDELTGWGCTVPPILTDARDQRQIQPLVRGLEKRGLRYVIRVPENALMLDSLGARRVLAETSCRRPKAKWLTNLSAIRLPELIGLVHLSHQTDRDMARLRDDFGLRHFEGRSYAGWHHHVTLVSAAHVYCTLQQLECGSDALNVV